MDISGNISIHKALATFLKSCQKDFKSQRIRETFVSLFMLRMSEAIHVKSQKDDLVNIS